MFGGPASSRPGSAEGPLFRAVLPSQVPPVPEPSGEPRHLLRTAVRASTAQGPKCDPEGEIDDVGFHHAPTNNSLMSARSGPKLSVSFTGSALPVRGRSARPSTLSANFVISETQVPFPRPITAGWLSSSSGSAPVSEGTTPAGDEGPGVSGRQYEARHPSIRSKSSTRGSMLSDRTGRTRSSPALDEHHAFTNLREQIAGVFSVIRRRAGRRCRALIKTRWFQVIMFIFLMAALFLPDLWVLLDRPDNHDLDPLMTIVLLAFLAELGVQSIGLTRTYWGSFFFWMDLIGALTVILDINYIYRFQASISSNVVLMRLARVAKLGVRAGRFTKLVKLMRFLPGMRGGADLGTAKLISNQLTLLLSMRVSILIILVVVIMPVFSIWSFPTEDWSMIAWMSILEALSNLEDKQFEQQLEQFHSFYGAFGYYPYMLDAKERSAVSNSTAALLPWRNPRGPPKRSSNVVHYDTVSLVCDFSFKQPIQMTSLMNMVVMVFVMLLMVIFSLLMSSSVAAIVLRPLEKLLMQVRNMADQIFSSVRSIENASEEEGEELHEDDDSCEEVVTAGSAFGCETALLEKVVQKLTILNEITMNKAGIDAETMAGLGEGDRAVIHGFAGGSDAAAQGGQAAWTRSRSMSEAELADEDNRALSLAAQNAMLEAAGLSADLLNSWSLNPLELDRARNRAAITYFLGHHNHGVQYEAVVMSSFLDVAEAGYIKTVPYHNWYHAVDVTHCIYRLLHICGAEAYLNGSERYALLVSAVCHDVGHPGLNNVFLVEASYELAVLYNDKSPLENMHCARLFEFVGTPKCNIFAALTKHQFQEVRKCCIESILHTDNVHHFPMIKEVQMLYEVNSEVLDAGRNRKQDEPFPPKDTVEVFRQVDTRRLLAKLLLHVADISNCSKPFRICKIWAFRVLEEFFGQGDEEKKAGLPVQAFNDREKVNKPMSQVGFIEFLVSPLQFAVIKVLAPIHELAENMVANTKTWHQEWLADTKPPPSDAERQTLAERVNKLEKRYLECRPVRPAR